MANASEKAHLCVKGTETHNHFMQVAVSWFRLDDIEGLPPQWLIKCDDWIYNVVSLSMLRHEVQS